MISTDLQDNAGCEAHAQTGSQLGTDLQIHAATMELLPKLEKRARVQLVRVLEVALRGPPNMAAAIMLVFADANVTNLLLASPRL